MKIADFKTVLLPAIETHTKYPLIKADQTSKKPDGPHATYKVTSPYLKDIGQSDITYFDAGDFLEVTESENHRATISFTAYAWDDDVSRDLAQSIRDWFSFYGQELLSGNDVVIVELTDVANRDAILLEEYERRNGFDVIIRLSRDLKRNIDYFDKVSINGEEIGGGAL